MKSGWNKNQPWYTQNKKQVFQSQERTHRDSNVSALSFMKSLKLFINGLVSCFFATIAGGFFYSAVSSLTHIGYFIAFFMIFLIFVFISVYFLIKQIGVVMSLMNIKCQSVPLFELGIQFLQGSFPMNEARKGMLAPEMALQQFVQQVRVYALEKSFQRHKGDKFHTDLTPGLTNSDNLSLIKRRWNDVVDSLNEFEIYLANDPQGMTSNLINKSPTQLMDVSQIFRDVAETFDNTWRRKGINIESAIVTPLKATTNEALLRRLLVGPWRASVYFARRGNGVVFSAKSEEGKVIAHWECDGLSIPDEYIEKVKKSNIGVNERIEEGMKLLAFDTNSPNTLFALISLVTWIDLANAAGCVYFMKPTNQGFVFELILK